MSLLSEFQRAVTGLALTSVVLLPGNPIGCFPDIASYNGPEDAQLCFDPIVTCSGCTFSLDFTAQALM